MKADTVFSPRRAWLYLAADLRLNFSSILSVTGGIAGLFFFMHFFRNPQEAPAALHANQLLLVFWLVLPAFAANAFTDIHKPLENRLSLTLPVSRTERFAAKWTEMTVVFALAVWIFYALLSAFLYIFDLIVMQGQSPFPIFLLPAADHLRIALGGILFSSVFFFGGVFFRKSQLAKTVLAIFSFLVGIFLVAACSFRVIFTQYPAGSVPSFMMEIIRKLGEGALHPLTANSGLFQLLFGLAFAIFFWFLAWLRLGETEAKGGLQK
jgi:ABC-type transport system involved in multi-copper enzyme maturation permease subunit